MWPWPRGKYQTSPGSKSLVSAQPCGSITVVRTRPSSTKAHSAAVACQCSSRIAPGSSFMETPAMPLEIGNCVTVASLPKLLPITLPCDCLQREFEGRQLLVGERGIGDVVHEARIAGCRRCVPGKRGERRDAGGGRQKLPAMRIGHDALLMRRTAPHHERGACVANSTRRANQYQSRVKPVS